MTSAWTLPRIRIELDNLRVGCEFILASDDAAGLFGASDSASRLVSVFAASHGCRAVFKRDELVFQKRLPSCTPASMDLPRTVECFAALSAPPRPASDDRSSVSRGGSPLRILPYGGRWRGA